MPCYVLTGAPGAGKTAILRLLERAGHRVVEEAATDVIALEQALGRPEPWTRAGFADAIAALQRQREDQAGCDNPAPTFFDRSPVCTLALTRYLGAPASALLTAEVERVVRDQVYAAVFLVRNLGFIEPTAARRITFEDSLRFESVHEQVYRELGFELMDIPAGPLQWRADLVREATGCCPVRGDIRTDRCDNPGDVRSG